MSIITIGIEGHYKEIHMAFTPYLTRKLYKTTLAMKEIVHPDTPAPAGTWKDTENWVSPVEWHVHESGVVYVTFWDDYKNVFNPANKNKFTLADADDVKIVQDMYAEVIRQKKNGLISAKYTSAELAVPDDDTKAGITEINNEVDAEYNAKWIIS